MKRAKVRITSCLAIGAALWAGAAAMAQQRPAIWLPRGSGELPTAPAAGPHVMDKALGVLIAASMSKQALARANAVEALQPLPDRALPVTQKSLTDANPGVRFSATVTAGMLRMKSLAPAIRPLVHDPNASVKAAAIYALHTLGDPIDISPLAGMLRSKDPTLRANTAMLLGLMGEPSAVPMLSAAAQVPMPRVGADRAEVVRVEMAEAIAKLGDDSSLDAIRAAAFSQFDEVRVLAVTSMGAVGDKRMGPGLEKFLASPPVELQLAAAGALARMGDTRGLGVAILNTAHQSPVVRAQAAWVLGWFNDPLSLDHLAKLLDDPSEQVRIASAAAVVRREAPKHRAPSPPSSPPVPVPPVVVAPLPSPATVVDPEPAPRGPAAGR